MKFLVVVDFQNDFITGSLGTLEAQAIIPNVKKKVEEYIADKDARILFTQDTHFNCYMDSFEGKRLPVEHCISPTHGFGIQEDVLALCNTLETKKLFKIYFLNKHNIGSIGIGSRILDIPFEEEEDEYYEDDITHIEIIGLCTDICVITNALTLRSYFPNTQIIVDSSCCAGATIEGHQKALDIMKLCMIDIL